MSYSLDIKMETLNLSLNITIRSRRLVNYLGLPYPKAGEGIHEEESVYDEEAVIYLHKCLQYLLENSQHLEVTLLSTFLQQAIFEESVVKDAKRIHAEQYGDLSTFTKWTWLTLSISVIN